jgi:membrane protease YdiL (CAAX protease family)
VPPLQASEPGPRGTLPFFVAAFGITWSLQLPAVLALRGIIPGPLERYLLPLGLGAFGPLLAAVFVARSESGRAGVRALFRPLRLWRVAPGWYLVALGLFAATYAAGTAVYLLLGGTHAGPWLYAPDNRERIAAMVVFPIGEEIGWRGLALPRLQQRHGALSASLRLGVAWALWHTMMFLVAGTSATLFTMSCLNIIAGSVVFTWIYNHTRGSLLLAILAHVGVHLSNPAHALPGNPTPFLIFTVALCVVAGALVLADRTLGRAPPDGSWSSDPIK